MKVCQDSIKLEIALKALQVIAKCKLSVKPYKFAQKILNHIKHIPNYEFTDDMLHVDTDGTVSKSIKSIYDYEDNIQRGRPCDASGMLSDDYEED